MLSSIAAPRFDYTRLSPYPFDGTNVQGQGTWRPKAIWNQARARGSHEESYRRDGCGRIRGPCAARVRKFGPFIVRCRKTARRRR